MSARLLPVIPEQQLVPDKIEYALNALIDSALDLSALAVEFRNDETGAPAYGPDGDPQACTAGLLASHGEQPGD